MTDHGERGFGSLAAAAIAAVLARVLGGEGRMGALASQPT